MDSFVLKFKSYLKNYTCMKVGFQEVSERFSETFVKTFRNPEFDFKIGFINLKIKRSPNVSTTLFCYLGVYLVLCQGSAFIDLFTVVPAKMTVM